MYLHEAEVGNLVMVVFNYHQQFVATRYIDDMDTNHLYTFKKPKARKYLTGCYMGPVWSAQVDQHRYLFMIVDVEGNPQMVTATSWGGIIKFSGNTTIVKITRNEVQRIEKR